MGRTRAIHVDLSLNPDDMTKELRELIPEAFKTEESSTIKEMLSSPTTPFLLGLATAASFRLDDVTLHPTPTTAPAAKPAPGNNQPPLPDQGQPAVEVETAEAGPSLKDTMNQQTGETSQVTAPSLYGDSSQPPSNSPADSTKEDKVPIAK